MDFSPATSFVIGAVFVAFHAAHRFFETDTDLHRMNSLRYVAATSFYVLVSEGVFLLLTFGIAILIQLKPILSLPTSHFLDLQMEFLEVTFGTQSPPLVAALLLTVLLPHAKYLDRIDRAISRYFHRIGALSKDAILISRALRWNKCVLSEPRQSRIYREFERRGFAKADMDFCCADQQTPRYVWIRLVTLWDELSGWSDSQSPYYPFVRKNEAIYNRLNADFKESINKAKNCFNLYKAASEDQELLRAVEDCKEQYTAQIKLLLRETSDFISRGILSVKHYRMERRDAVKAFGVCDYYEDGFSVHDIVRAFVIFFVVVLGLLLVLDFLLDRSVGTQERPLGNTLLLAVVIAVNYCIAALCASGARVLVLNGTKIGERVWGTYLAASFLAIPVAMMIGIPYSIYKHGDLLAGFNEYSTSGYVWLLIPFVAAFVFSYLLDSKSSRVDDIRIRLRDGALMSAIASLSASLVWLWLSNKGISIPLEKILTMHAILGFIAGYNIPAWYYKARAFEEYEKVLKSEAGGLIVKG